MLNPTHFTPVHLGKCKPAPER